MIGRRTPRPGDSVEWSPIRTTTLDRTGARVEHAHTIADLRGIAQRVTSWAPFDHTSGVAEQKVSPAHARQALVDVEFLPGNLRHVPVVDKPTRLQADRRRRRCPVEVQG